MVLNTLLTIKMTIKLKHCVWNFQKMSRYAKYFYEIKHTNFLIKDDT